MRPGPHPARRHATLPALAMLLIAPSVWAQPAAGDPPPTGSASPPGKMSAPAKVSAPGETSTPAEAPPQATPAERRALGEQDAPASSEAAAPGAQAQPNADATAATARETERTREPGPHGVDLRFGALVPQQELDGLGLHVSLGWRYHLLAWLAVFVEGGLNRISATGISEAVSAPGGLVRVRLDHTSWTLPVSGGLAASVPAGGRMRLGLALGGGPAWTVASLERSVVGGEGATRDDAVFLDALVLARLEATWAVPSGALVVTAGGQWVPTGGARVTGDFRATGAVLEGGWRARF